MRTRTLSNLRGLVIGVSLWVALAACGGRSDGGHAVNLDLQPIQSLANAADAEAQSMEDHAATIVAAATGRPDVAQWQSEVETLRAQAKSLRLLASWAQAIHHDPGARDDSAADLLRILGDGRNLEQLGETLVAHAAAMQTHLPVMRQQAAGDAALTAAVGRLSTDIEGMQRSGQGAIGRGKELQETARRLAQGTGTKLN